MRLRELNFRQLSHGELGNILAGKGYQKIGIGSYARIYAKQNDPFVLKIFENSDHAFEAFVAMTLKYPSPHWPQWRSKLMRINEVWNAIRMERLDEADTDPETNQTFDDICDWFRFGGRSRMEDFHTGDTEWMKAELTKRKAEHDAALERVNANKPLQQAMMHLHDLTGSGKMRLDMKIDNMMRRGNVLVFVDPVAPQR